MMPVGVLIVDDQRLFREGLRSVLDLDPKVEIIGEAAHGAEALERIAARRPDVVLMDLRMPVMDGVEATRRIGERWPDLPVLVLTTFDDDDSLFGALRAGAAGYLLKDASADTVRLAIRAAACGEAYLQTRVAARVLAEFGRLSRARATLDALVVPLSKREREILAVLAGGASNKEIAARLHLAEGTVKNHVTNILGKLDVRDRTQAALRAAQLRLL